MLRKQKKATIYQIPINSLPLNVAVYRYVDDDFVFVDFNKRAEITENINKDALLGKKLCDVFPAVKEFGLYEVLLRVQKSGVDESFERGFYQDYRISGWRKNEIISLPNGDIMVIYEDLTKIKQIEQENSKHKKQLEEAHKSVRLGSWTWDMRTNVIEWSDEVFHIFGENVQSFRPTLDKFLSYSNKEDQEKLRGLIENSIKAKEPYQFERKIIREDGSVRFVQERASAHYDDLGEAEMMIGTMLDVTEYKTVTNQLQSLGMILDNSLNEIYIFDAKTLNFSYVNQAAQKNIGYSLEELQAMTPVDIKPYHTMESFLSLVEPMLRGFKNTLSFETTHRRKDGSDYFVEIKLQIMEVNNKKRFVVIADDVTKRKEAQFELINSELKFRNIAENSLMGIFIYGEEYLYVNDAFASTLGFSKEELYHMKPWEVAETINFEKLKEVVEERLQGKEFSKTYNDMRMLTKNGDVKIMHVSTKTIKYRDKFAGMGTVIDITSMKGYEEQLKTLTIRLSLATQAASIGVWEWDIKADTLKWDEQMYNLYGISKDQNEMSYETWSRALDSSDIAKSELQLQNLIKGEGEYNLQFWISPPNHEKRFIQAMGAIEHNELGEAHKFVGVNWDITKQKLYERELESAKKRAETANMAKSNFLANMSHEIRTPMNAIFGMIQLAQTLPLSPELQDYLGKIDKSSNLLLHIINDILDFSKIEANKLDIVNSQFNLNETIEQFSSLYGAQAKAKGLEFAIHVSKEVPVRLLGDNLRLTQILNNLIANAIKFTKSGSIEIFIACVGKSGDKVALKFSVKDSGLGIALKDQKKLFNMFTQADESITRRYGGTGLGLSISKRLAELMGGTLEFSSEYKKGIMFEVTIEFGYVEANGYFNENSSLRDEGLTEKLKNNRERERRRVLASAKSIRGASVLLVEDNDVNIQVQTEFLVQMGLKVTIVTDGLQAVELLKTKRFDGILMDYQMPVMDGIEATKAIRRSGNETPIIAMTAAAMQSDKENCLLAGMNDYVSKPIDFLKMVQVLTKWIEPNFKRDEFETMDAKEILPHATLPQSIDAIDMEEGLRNSAQSPTLYHNVLLRFFYDYSKGCKPLRESLSNKDVDGAKRWIHTLKGLSATIGAVKLNSIVRDMELELKNRFDVALDALCEELQRLNASLASLVEVKNVVKSSYNYELALKQLNFISEKLKNSQLVEQEDSDKLHDALGSHVETTPWTSLQNALENFEYDKAQVEIGKLMELMEGET